MTTQIILYENVPLDISQSRQINYPNGNLTTQRTFFNQFIYRTFEGCRWVYPNKIRLNISYEDALTTNYVKYRQSTTDKDFYAFIVSKNYINDNTTEFEILTDYYQTYIFDHSLEASYIDREHKDRATKSGSLITRKYDTVKEVVDTGDLLEVSSSKTLLDTVNVSGTMFKKPTLIIAKDNLITDTLPKPFYNVEGINTPFIIYLGYTDTGYIIEGKKFKVRCRVGSSYITQIVNIKSATPLVAGNDKVVSHVPIKRVPFNPVLVGGGSGSEYYDLTNIDGLEIEAIKYQTIDNIDYYVLILVKHNNAVRLDDIKTSDFIPNFIKGTLNSNHIITNESKLYTYPYFRYQLLNNYATIKELKNEYFKNGEASYNVFYDFIASIDFRETLKINNYNEPNSLYVDATEKSLPLNTDNYLLYLEQNKASRTAGIGIPIASTLLGIGATALGGGAVGIPLIMGGITSIGSVIAQDQARISDLQARPDTIRQVSGNVLLDLKSNHFNYTLKSLELVNDYKLRIYDYFRLYGYKSGRHLKPNLDSRYYFNYIKTMGANIVPVNDKAISNEAIKYLIDLYDRGVLIYHVRNNSVNMTNTKENIEMGLL